MVGRITSQWNATVTAFGLLVLLAGCSSGGTAGTVGPGSGSSGAGAGASSGGASGGDDGSSDNGASGGAGTSSGASSDDGTDDASDNGNPPDLDATADADEPDDSGDPGTGFPGRDAGPNRRRDAGVPARDAGSTTGRDAGTPVKDAGTPVVTGDAGAALAAARAQCVQIINQDRATLSPASPPLTEDTAQEACVDMQAQADFVANTAHSAFGNCHESAQDECPNWPGPPSSIMTKCLAQMWAEGPPPKGQDNHWLNMSNSDYTKVACGFYQTPSGSWWATQDFY